MVSTMMTIPIKNRPVQFWQIPARGKSDQLDVDIPPLLSLLPLCDDGDEKGDDDDDGDDDKGGDDDDDDESETRMARGRRIRSDQVNKTQHKVSQLHSRAVLVAAVVVKVELVVVLEY